MRREKIKKAWQGERTHEIFSLRALLPCGQGPCKGAARDAWDRHGVGVQQVIDNIETVY